MGLVDVKKAGHCRPSGRWVDYCRRARPWYRSGVMSTLLMGFLGRKNRRRNRLFFHPAIRLDDISVAQLPKVDLLARCIRQAQHWPGSAHRFSMLSSAQQTIGDTIIVPVSLSSHARQSWSRPFCLSLLFTNHNRNHLLGHS